MPKEINLPDYIRTLRAASPDGAQVHYLKLANPIALKLAEQAQNRGVTFTVQVREAMTDYVEAAERGVVTRFDPQILGHLDLTCSSLGLSREALVRMIVADHLQEYLARALHNLSQRKEQVEKIQEKRAGKR